MRQMNKIIILTALLPLCITLNALGNEVPEEHGNGYHFTRQATYFYNDFLAGEDAQTLGLETDAKFGLGDFHVRHIMYLEAMDYPRPIPGKWSDADPENPDSFKDATGIGDLLNGFWVSPKSHGHHNLEVGYGFGMQFPTASDESLGSEKWAAGPSIDIEYRSGRFFAGTIIMQLWSFAGNEDRKDVNMLIAKYFLMYDLNEDWKLISIPYGISYYWNKPSDEALSLPIGGGLQYNFSIGSQEMSFHAQYFNYVVRPSKGSEADLRFTLEFYF
jgi:hypothetical protein